MSEITASSGAVQWVAVADDLWVASRDGEFLGTVEHVENRYVAVDGRGTPVGVNGTLAGAQGRLDARTPIVVRPPTVVRPSIMVRLRQRRLRRSTSTAA